MTKTKKQRVLLVHARIWHEAGKPRWSYRTKTGNWLEAKSLAEARTYAADNGYAGIRVIPRS